MNPNQCKTIRIKSTHPKSQGDFVEINESDFDKKIHELYEEVSEPVKPKKAAKVKKETEADAVPPPPRPLEVK